MAATGGKALPIPDVLDLRGGGGPQALDAMAAHTTILEGRETVTVGYGQGFLGPVIRVRRGETARLNLGNRINEPVTVHWHGMHIDGDQDGGPHSPIANGEVMEAVLDIDQPAATLWYHSHIHQRTATHVWFGLAGMLIVDDPDAPDAGLPGDYGVDDIPLVVQDRIFDSGGQMLYAPQGPTLMMGYRGSEILVNGAIRPQATVPPAMVRLRVLNGSNARIFHFGFEDGRQFYQVASDGGLLPAPVPMNTLTLAPAERAEIIVDFSDGAAARLLSAPDNNTMMGGMGGGMMGMMQGGHGMAINGVSMDMGVINEKMRLGEAEIWQVSTSEMAHPFHVHGCSFQVLSLNGQKVDFGRMGMKDVVLVDGTAELLVQVDRKANADQPFMYHCHILEHEDLGMMGQFTVA